MSVGNSNSQRVRAAHLGPERRRPAVLDAALRLGVARGLRGVTMEAIAQELGVTKPVVYSCFASREELLTSLLEREEQRLFQGVMSALPSWPDYKKPELMMRVGFQALLTTVAAHADSWRLVFMADPDPAIAERYGQARRLVAQQVAIQMAPGLAAWGVQDIDRKLPVLVEMFMSIGDGAVRALLLTDNQWSPADLGNFIGGLVLGALKKA